MTQRTVTQAGSVVVVVDGMVVVVVTPGGSETTTNSLKEVTCTVSVSSVTSQHPGPPAHPFASMVAQVGVSGCPSL